MALTYWRRLAEHKWYLEQVELDPNVMVRRGDFIIDLQRRVDMYDPFGQTLGTAPVCRVAICLQAQTRRDLLVVPRVHVRPCGSELSLIVCVLDHRYQTPHELAVGLPFTDEETRGSDIMQHKPLGPFTVDADELLAASEERRIELLEREELPFES